MFLPYPVFKVFCKVSFHTTASADTPVKEKTKYLAFKVMISLHFHYKVLVLLIDCLFVNAICMYLYTEAVLL